MSKIEFKDLSFSYRETRKKEGTIVFENFSVSFVSNAFNVIVGPSGCGKTTLLRLITGVIDDYSGDIFIDDVNTDDLSVSERNIGYINQNFALYPHLTVFDNIAFPLKAMHLPKNEIISRVNAIAERLDLSVTLFRKPKYLSIGQRQRVALARGLVKNAKIYLFDEPFSNADALKRADLRTQIKKIVKEHNATTIYVTHDFKEAMALADYLFVMDNGKIAISGKPMDVYKSGNEIVNDYIKATFIDIDYEKEN